MTNLLQILNNSIKQLINRLSRVNMTQQVYVLVCIVIGHVRTNF